MNARPSLRLIEEQPRSGAFGLTLAEVRELGLGAAAFAALHRPWTWVRGPALGRKAHAVLASHGLDLPQVRALETSRDGSTKVVLAMGRDRIEAVHMPRAVRGERTTVCISSQVGCAMGCTFCATASMGFVRHLTASELVAQVTGVVARLGPRHPSDLTLVFMGMGEPLHNLPAVARAIEILCTPEGLSVAPRRITVSTSGLVPELERLGALRVRPLLAVSLNATTDELRAELMPVNRRYPLRELRQALTKFPLRSRERITVEYVLLAGVNDHDDDAQRLADFCEPFAHNINLIPFNEHALAPFRAPTDTAVDRFFRKILARRRTLVTVRRSRGRDVNGACGQLVNERSGTGS